MKTPHTNGLHFLQWFCQRKQGLRLTIFLFIFSLMGGQGLYAQEVESPAFRLMLGSLLSHTVPETGVEALLESPNTWYLDARAFREFEVSHIRDAKWVGYDDFSIDRVVGIPKNAKVVVYCSVGYRSEKVSEKLMAAGYENVSNLVGGIFEWVNQGQPVFNSDGVRTDLVHAYDKSWGVWLQEGKKVYQ
jgi:rhodanese-related sulfurtransferase